MEYNHDTQKQTGFKAHTKCKHATPASTDLASTAPVQKGVRGLSDLIAGTEVSCANKLDERECEELAEAVMSHLRTLCVDNVILIKMILI